MKIVKIKANPDYTLQIVAHDGRVGIFDVRPYIKHEAFSELKDKNKFMLLLYECRKFQMADIL